MSNEQDSTEYRACAQCGGWVLALSARGWCDSCEETGYELAFPEIAAAPFDAGRVPCPQGGEDRWSARWLMQQMGYPTWQHFEPVVERAKTAAHNEGFNVRTLFTVDRKNTGGRPQTDYLVTRYAAYLIAMNGDPRKREVAAAQHYFAVKTREAEVAPSRREPTEDEILHRAMHILDRRVEALTAQNQALTAKVDSDAPKVAAWEQFMEADGNYSLGTAAKLLGARGQNGFIAELRRQGVLIPRGAMYNTPYQRYMHHFDVKVRTYEVSDGTTGTGYTTRVRPSGLHFLARKLGRKLRPVDQLTLPDDGDEVPS